MITEWNEELSVLDMLTSKPLLQIFGTTFFQPQPLGGMAYRGTSAVGARTA
jgi:hypothetical protein